MWKWIRTLRTNSSERFLALRQGMEVAAMDIHYLTNGTVAGTVILFREAGWKADDVNELLRSFDEDYLPDVDLSHGNLTFTVVFGEVLSNFEAYDESKKD